MRATAWSPPRAIVTGALVVGTLDLLDAIVFFGLRNGVTPVRILQSIASGWLGRASFQQGTASAALGLATHYFIASGIVMVFYLASRGIPLLTRHPVPCGLVYGLLAYAVMNLVVLPLSAAGTPHPSTPVLINGLAIHAFGVGLPTALIIARARRPASP